MIKVIIIILFLSQSFGNEISKNYDIELIFGNAVSKITNKNFRGLNELNNFLIRSNYNVKSEKIFLKISPVFIDGRVVFDESFIKYKFKDSYFYAGRYLSNLTSENKKYSSGSMIESGNSLIIPKIGLTTKKEIFDLIFDFEIYHGIMKKNDQITKAPFLHDKKLYVRKYHNDAIFSIGLNHSAIWGGASIQYGTQPLGFKNFVRVFLGDKSEDNVGTISDQGNALGEVKGMWDFSIDINRDFGKTRFYYQYFFEDGSGLKFQSFDNKFDGLIGLQHETEHFFFIFEFLKTTYQGGPVHPPGVDSYYFTRAYPPGWVYEGRSIGNMFINPMNNRTKMNHIFYKYKFTDLSFFIDAAFGKYFIPYTEKMDYSDLILNDNGTKFEEFVIGFEKIFQKQNFILKTFFEKESVILSINYIF